MFEMKECHLFSYFTSNNEQLLALNFLHHRQEQHLNSETFDVLFCLKNIKQFSSKRLSGRVILRNETFIREEVGLVFVLGQMLWT
jgi:hypothetical protein